MAEEKIKKEVNVVNVNKYKGGTSSAVYGLGFIGALVYFLQHAQTFGQGLLGILKAIFWPALLIYKVFELLKF